MTVSAILLVAAAAAAGADEPRWRDPPACWDGPQSELNHCAGVEFRQADAEMKAQLERTIELMKRLDAENPPNPVFRRYSHFDALLKAQEAWLAYREAHCHFLGAGGGTIASMVVGICLRDLTRERTKQLAELMLNPASGNPYFEDQ